MKQKMDIDKKENEGRKILVIGGGIMGLGSAWYLSQRWVKLEIQIPIFDTYIIFTKKFEIKIIQGLQSDNIGKK